ncbi:MAG: hypothetical protein L6Q26_09215 [Anaerolineales bacterium]|nr:hypothetical protein [Anaerolineales bacterium]NUQ84683.1 hypothetical protein [Anaerolineales bacterium]
MNLFSRLKRQSPPPPTPTPVPDDPTEPPLTTVLKTLVIVYDPLVDRASGKKLSEAMQWNRVEDLARGFMSDILLVSGELARYRFVERLDVDDFPVKVDGYKYDAQTYLNVARSVSPPYMPQEADYYAILEQFHILERVAEREIDEVWIFNFPHAGFYESIMGGPGAFWCNAPPLQRTEAAGRRFVIMGFSLERGVGEMLENMGHRAESIMEKTFETLPEDQSLWKRFIRYEKAHPGKAACGTVHFAPNSLRDYDWNNPTPVASECDDWLYNFPDFKGATRVVTSAEWGNGDTREHHKWWFRHIPKAAGRKNGIHNNWWQYIMDPNNVQSE